MDCAGTPWLREVPTMTLRRQGLRLSRVPGASDARHLRTRSRPQCDPARSKLGLTDPVFAAAAGRHATSHPMIK